MNLNKHLKLHVNIVVSDNFSLIQSATNHFLYLKFKSLTHALLKMVVWVTCNDFISKGRN